MRSAGTAESAMPAFSDTLSMIRAGVTCELHCCNRWSCCCAADPVASTAMGNANCTSENAAAALEMEPLAAIRQRTDAADAGEPLMIGWSAVQVAAESSSTCTMHGCC